MATTWYTVLIAISFTWFLLFGQCHLESGDSTSGDLEDGDYDQKGTAQKLQLIVSAPYITKNSSDFIYPDVARDDHEVIVNLRRLKKKKSRNITRKSCLVSVLDTSIAKHCFEN